MFCFKSSLASKFENYFTWKQKTKNNFYEIQISLNVGKTILWVFVIFSRAHVQFWKILDLKQNIYFTWPKSHLRARKENNSGNLRQTLCTFDHFGSLFSQCMLLEWLEIKKKNL